MNNLFVITILLVVSIYTIASVLSGRQIIIKTKAHHENIHLSIFYFGALVGVLIFLLTGQTSLSECCTTIIGDSHLSPLGILILFLSMAFISIFLDYCGFFQYCASWSIRYAGKSQLRLFVILYATVSILTIFTSNDIIILTFTPFIYYFANNRKISPLPYLLAEFFAANTWSMALYIGNPTNIILSDAIGLTFFDYSAKMLLPTLCAGISNFVTIFLIFRKSLSVPLDIPQENVPPKLKDKHGSIVGLVILIVCIISLSVANFIKLKTYQISAFFASVLFVFIIIRMFYNYKKSKNRNKIFKNPILVHTFKKMPWNVIPFIICLSILVNVANKNGICKFIADFLLSIIGQHSKLTPTVFGIASTLSANVLNNIPMSVLFVDIIGFVPDSFRLSATFATIIGSNLGANITPLGALAGIMWMTILKNHGVKFSFRDFTRYGSLVTTFSLLTSLVCLSLICL